MSLHPSLSESNSKASIIPSESESFKTFDSLASAEPFKSESTKPVSKPEIIPSLLVSKASLPDSTTS